MFEKTTASERIVPTDWSPLDDQAVNVSRALVLDAVENADGGHAGSAMAVAPLLYVLYQKVLRHDPTDPGWEGRDRFILSCGHLSLAQYVQLYLAGYEIGIDDLRAFRKWGSITPSHPEYGRTPGVEMSTGPLGQGLSSAVGMAMALSRQDSRVRSTQNPAPARRARQVWVLASDGDMQEGISSEASSLAGHLAVDSLNVIYDRNRISTEGHTNLSFSEDVAARYRSYGWSVLHVPDVNSAPAVLAALLEARDNESVPTLIIADSIIGWPAPNAMGKATAHSGPFGPDEVRATKRILGLPEDQAFYVPEAVLAHTRRSTTRARSTAEELPASRSVGGRMRAGSRREKLKIDGRFAAAFLTVPPYVGGEVSTRQASGDVLNAVSPTMPHLWGGSADLGKNTFTTIAGSPNFGASGSAHKSSGSNVFFGVREHAMGAILNGIALTGDRPFGGTFLVFSDYMRPAVRLAAIMRLPVIYVWTHDSIAVGEDGPTHQPVEHLASLRAIENLNVVRPADANETASAWRRILETDDTPSALVLSRQALPVLPHSSSTHEDVARGGYVVWSSLAAFPKVMLIATGSEVHLALGAAKILEAEGIPTRVVSMPCVEWFNEQTVEYREKVLPSSVRARVSVEAGVGQGWRELVGDLGEIVAVTGYGASAAGEVVYADKGFTEEEVVARAHKALGRLAE